MSSSPPATIPSVLSSSPPSSPSSSCDDDSKDELVDVQPSQVTFLEILKTKVDRENGNGNLVITFKVEIQNKLCVMKVFKDNEYGDTDFYIERSAYRLLKEKGFCKRGLVPKFYGTIEHIDTNLWPELYEFADDRFPPSAILIEYIPNAKKIDLSNFSQDNIDRLSAILAEFHKVGLLHGDPYPRNMMVVRGPPDRVFWLDFDNSQVEDRTIYDKHTEYLFELESQAMTGFAKALSEDAKIGKLEKTFYFYC